MFDAQLLNQLKSYTANMKQAVRLELASGDHAKKAELIQFLTQFSSVSDLINLIETDQTDLPSPISFRIKAEQDTGIVFSGIPSGHEFSSLVLAVLQASGTPIKLDEAVQNLVKKINVRLNFQVFVSLSCHNCPDVVQALNQMAIINPLIGVETIDGGLFPDLVAAKNIQGVPCVFLNNETFSNGKIDTAQIIAKLTEKFPELVQTNDQESLIQQQVTVIGGGPAGVSAAIYAARKGLKTTIITDRLGGQLKDTLGIENFISMPKTTGPELSQALASHLKDYPITIKEAVQVKDLEKLDSNGLFRIDLSSGEWFYSQTVIMATGAKWRELGVPGEKENIGQGVAYCPHCDGPFFKDKSVAVIGGGNSGIEAALDLAGIVKDVTVFEFMPTLKADQVLVDHAQKTENIKILTSVAVKEILATDKGVYALNYLNRETNTVIEYPLSGVFVQIGLVPNSQLVKDWVETTAFGEIKINERCETSLSGLYACGDVTTVPYKQIIIAMGEGAKAALSAFDQVLKSK